MNPEERIAKVNEWLAAAVKKEIVIIPQHGLVEDLGLNSLQFINLISKIEEAFNVMVPIQKLQTIKTVADLQDAVRRLEEFCR